MAITDEIYEHILFDGAEHVALAALPGMRERTVTVNGMSKTYSVTGWRVGYAIAPPPLTAAIRKVHDFLTVGAAAPLQEAGVTALGLPEAYYRDLARTYERKRDRFLPALEKAGFRCFPPQGAYYVMADIAGIAEEDDGRSPCGSCGRRRSPRCRARASSPARSRAATWCVSASARRTTPWTKPPGGSTAGPARPDHRPPAGGATASEEPCPS